MSLDDTTLGFTGLLNNEKIHDVRHIQPYNDISTEDINMNYNEPVISTNELKQDDTNDVFKKFDVHPINTEKHNNDMADIPDSPAVKHHELSSIHDSPKPTSPPKPKINKIDKFTEFKKSINESVEETKRKEEHKKNMIRTLIKWDKEGKFTSIVPISHDMSYEEVLHEYKYATKEINNNATGDNIRTMFTCGLNIIERTIMDPYLSKYVHTEGYSKFMGEEFKGDNYKTIFREVGEELNIGSPPKTALGRLVFALCFSTTTFISSQKSLKTSNVDTTKEEFTNHEYNIAPPQRRARR